MRRVLNRVCAVVVIGALALVSASITPGHCDEPKRLTEKAPALTLDQKYEKLKDGLLKTTEAEVVALMGPAHNMRRSGQLGNVDIELRWEYATSIKVTFKGGKVSEVWGTFSEYVPVDKLTPENLRRVQPGMTEKEVIAILGNRTAIGTVNDVGTGLWGDTAEIRVSFNKDGRMVQREKWGTNYGPRK
jgi:hypothetical protein